MSALATAAIVFVVATGAILAFAVLYGFTSTHRAVSHPARAVGRASVPYWHTDTGIEEERGVTPEERPARDNAV